MPNDYIDQIQVGTTTYDIQDNIARQNIQSLSTSLSTMAFVDDAPFNNKNYGRKNGEWIEIVKGEGSNIDLSIIAESFTTLISYSTNDYVIYEDELYRFTDNHNAGAWTTTDIIKVNITDEISNRKHIIQTEYNSQTKTVEFIDAEAISGGGDGGPVSWGNIIGILSNQIDLNEALSTKANIVDINEALSTKANIIDLGAMATIDDAPSDNKEYARKNNTWSEIIGGNSSSTSWGDITGTLSNQTDLNTALASKQGTLTFDSTPTENSTNPVTSDGIYTALSTKQEILTFDSTPSLSSTNPVTSEGIYLALTDKVNTSTLGNLATLNNIDYTENYITNKPTLGGIQIRPDYIISSTDLDENDSLTTGLLYFYYEV